MFRVNVIWIDQDGLMIMIWDVHGDQQYTLFRDLALTLLDMERGSGTRHSLHPVQLLTLVPSQQRVAPNY